jgi:hypothetical protein
LTAFENNERQNNKKLNYSGYRTEDKQRCFQHHYDLSLISIDWLLSPDNYEVTATKNQKTDSTILHLALRINRCLFSK